MNHIPGHEKQSFAAPSRLNDTKTRTVSVESAAALTNGAAQSSPTCDMVTGRCMCCHCELQYPELAARYRCPTCETVNDLKPSLDKLRSCPPLTLRKLRDVVNDCKENERIAGVNSEVFYEPVEALVDTVFCNWMCLNASFSNGKSTTLEESGVALDDVRKAFRILLQMPVNVIRSLMKAIDKILKRPNVPLRRLSDIRFLLIILENPLLAQHNFPAETKYHNNLLQHVYGLISCLNNECHHALVNWLTLYPSDVFLKQVELVHKFLSYRVGRSMKNHREPSVAYGSDWKIISASRVMALLFASNQQSKHVPLSSFYNTMVDYIDLMGDYLSWQSRSSQFAFCQYPFLISMGSKMKILDNDAKQQMELKRREAFFNMLFHQQASSPHVILSIRRPHLIEDSLRQLVQLKHELKKSIRVQFDGEEGVDAGGLRKEWFLLLVRSLFDPQYGMFTFDEDSNLCWFNPSSFENEDQFYLVGLILGLAIYNSTILDIPLPLACYKKLLDHPVDLDDLRVLQPSLYHGLQQLLSFSGDVASTFCRTFVIDIDRFDEHHEIPLMPNGDQVAVTNLNRQRFVDLYVDYILNKSVKPQFDAFRRGFYQMCGGNALSLFRPEEIELLVRGSDEALDIPLLQSQTEYHGFTPTDITVKHFWKVFETMATDMQRKLMMFVTGCDRIPATGSSQLKWNITCGGDDTGRLPSAHTCFNQLVLYRYHSQQRLQLLLERAILESQGFYVQ
ncbi:hypothetical protein DM01DRAFT_1337612 [Hesseltinella vesiculosa]|uniref:HECT-type E3 ubiquitin transferase n=1 Tax=Hesseltinella vesiculosa TaxID=101127 RepID=A0A1X2GD34_9FUNG|nr:hypothetical protein DM01DRAFT_1337612 [Hesseltinella vesiculosa]